MVKRQVAYSLQTELCKLSDSEWSLVDLVVGAELREEQEASAMGGPRLASLSKSPPPDQYSNLTSRLRQS